MHLTVTKVVIFIRCPIQNKNNTSPYSPIIHTTAALPSGRLTDSTDVGRCGRITSVTLSKLRASSVCIQVTHVSCEWTMLDTHGGRDKHLVRE